MARQRGYSRNVALRDFLKRWRGPLPAYVEGNRSELLIDGGAFFDAVVALIQSAQHYVCLEFYIVTADSTGWRIAEALVERAKAGVEVAFSYDWYGSVGLDDEYIQYLEAAGVKVLAFGQPSLRKMVWPWGRRNHRKLVIADGRVGIVGGLNLAAEYDAQERGGGNWRDTAVRVEGPVVADLELMFRRLWARQKGKKLSSTPTRAEPFPGGDPVYFYGNYARRDRAFIRRAYLQAILSAQRTVRITNAYFIPDRVLRRALTRAAQRGVQVEVIVAGATDVPPALLASRAFYPQLLKGGVGVFEFHERVLHAKTAVIDGEWSTIGSSNLDYWSSYVNLEVNAAILGRRVGGAMEDQFSLDRQRSQQIRPESWGDRPLKERLMDWMLRTFFRWY